MKPHTVEFKQELIKMGKQIDSFITYTENNEQITLHDELYSVTPLFEANLMKSVMKQIEVESSVEIPYGTIINYQLGLLIGNEYEYLDYGNYVVFSNEKQEDTNTYKITCYDKMIYAMKPYEELSVTYPITIKAFLSAIATQMGLTLKDTDFYNYALQIHEDLYKDLEYTYRDVLDEIAQATGSIIIINNDDQLEVIYPTNSNDTINEEYFKDINVNFSEKYGPINSIVLSRAGESDSVYIQDAESIAENGLCEVKIVDNQIMNFNDRSDYLQGLLNALGGIEYYINDFESLGILYYDVGDYYNVSIRNKIYKCLMLSREINVTSGLKEIIHTEMPEQSETDYTKADKTDRRINQTYIIVDKQNQKIESVVSNVSEQNRKISQITQTVDDLQSQISDIADITTYGESSYASVSLADVNESEPIMLKVHPTTSNISKLYPRYNLYPSSTLFMTTRKIRFIRTYEEEGETLTQNIDYELPDDLLVYDTDTYDEFYLDYESQTCQVIKRCGYNADGTVYALASEVVNTYPYPTIVLGEGDYTIEILNQQYGYIYVRLMAKNIYTTQFYTKAETNSLIEQTASSIDLSVNQKLTNYSTTNEMNSAISVKANEITSTVSSTYETKVDATDKLNSAKSYTDTNVTTLSSRITQNANSITAEVTRATNKENTLSASISLKIDKTDNNQIISMINASANRITLTAGRLVITSGNFKLDASGNVTCTNGNFTGKVTASSGKIADFTIDGAMLVGNNVGMSGTAGQGYAFWAGSNNAANAPFRVGHDGSFRATNADITGAVNATSGSFTGTVNARGTFTVRGSDGLLDCQINNYGVYYYGNDGSYYGMTTASTNNGSVGVSMVSASGGAIGVGGNTGYCDASGGFYAYNFFPISREEYKKNIERYKNSAINLIKNAEIYTYNYKQEEDNNKKHIGFIIGNKYKTPTEVISENQKGIDMYSMASILWKATQELIDKVEKLEKGA